MAGPYSASIIEVVEDVTTVDHVPDNCFSTFIGCDNVLGVVLTQGT